MLRLGVSRGKLASNQLQGLALATLHSSYWFFTTVSSRQQWLPSHIFMP